MAGIRVASILRVGQLAAAGYPAASIRRRVRLPQATVSLILAEVHVADLAGDRDDRAETVTARHIDAALTRRPMYDRDGQDNPMPPVVGHEQPGPTGIACHTTAYNRVDGDYLEDRARGINQTSSIG